MTRLGDRLTPPAYAPRPTKRTRRTKAEIEAIKTELFFILNGQHPATCRSVFYQAVSKGVVDKTEAEYKGTVCRLLVLMRRNREIPYSWIADGTRWIRKNDSYSSLEDMLDQSVKFYRRAIWSDQPVYVEMWSEKDAITDSIFDVTDSFDVPLMVGRGFSSLTFLHAAGEAIREKNKRTFIYQIGDHDPSGVDIAHHVENGLREFAPDVDITFTRLAVTPEQIEELRLPTRPTKTTDSRSGRFTGESVDVDAIPAPYLRDLIEQAIVSHIDSESWCRTRDIEEAERGSLENLVLAYRGGGS